MSNTTTGGRENKIASTTQRYLRLMSVMPKLANFQLNNNLTRGQKVNRPFKSDFSVDDYTALTDPTQQEWQFTQELLTVDQSKVVRMDWDPVEKKQIEFDPESEFISQMAYRLTNQMDQGFLGEVDNASNDLDDGDFGGTDGNPIDLDSVNAEKVWGQAFAVLSNLGVEPDRRWVSVVDAFMLNAINQRQIATTFNSSDSGFMNGEVKGGQFVGFDLVMSSNLPSSQVLTYTGLPSNGETIKIFGVTFTFVSSIGTTQGNVLIEAGDDDTYTNLTNAINAGTGAGTKYIEFSTNKGINRKKLSGANLVAAQDTSADTVTLTANGDMGTIEALSNATLGDQTVKCLCMQTGAIDAVVQFSPTVQINKISSNLGWTVLAHTLYGIKTFADGADRMLKIAIKGR